MRAYFLGMLTTFLIGFGLQLTWFTGLDTKNDILIDIGYHGGEAIRGIYFVKPLTNRCSDHKRCNDCVINKVYFDCDKFQVKLNEILYGG